MNKEKRMYIPTSAIVVEEDGSKWVDYEWLQKQSLVPLSSKQVCKTLNEYWKRDNDIEKFYYDEEHKMFYYTWKNGNDIIKESFVVVKSYGIDFRYSLPPNLVTMIGIFYEGIDSNE